MTLAAVPQPAIRPADANNGAFRRRGVLFLVIALVLTCSVLGGIMLSVREYRRQQSTTEARLARDVDVLAQRVEQFFGERYESLNAIALAPPVQNQDIQATKAYFESVVQHDSSFSGGLSLIGKDGIMLLLSGFPLNEPPIDLSDRDYVRAVLATGAPSTGNAITGRRSGDPLLTFAVPVRNASQEMFAVLAGTIRLDLPESGFARLGILLSNSLVLDRSGQLVVDRGPVKQLSQAPSSLLLLARSGNPVVDGVPTSEDDDSLVSFTPIGESGWSAAQVYDRNLLFSDARRNLALQLAALAVVGLGGIAFISFAWRQARSDNQHAHDRELLLAELGQREAEYHLLADSMPQLVWAASSGANVDYYNDRVRQYGIRRDVNGDWNWEIVVHPDDIPGTQRAWQQAVDRDAPYEFEHRLKMADGTYRWHVSRAVPTRSPDGTTRWIGTATDIERLKVSEEDLNAALAVKDEFLGIISHDLRSPLAVILGNANLLRRGVVPQEEQAGAIEDIEVKSRELAATIDELIELARAHRDSSVDLEPLALGKVVAAIAVDLQKGVANPLCCSGTEIAAYVLGDERYIRRIIQNLVNNASKYSPPASPIDLAMKVEDSQVEVSVCDRGRGVDPQVGTRVFEPFFRIASGPKVPGLGIGLTLCKRLVEVQHGTIGLRPREGGGSEAWFRLPLASINDP